LNPASPFHHQTNSLKERVNSVIKQYFRCYYYFKGTDWYNFLYLSEFNYNNTVQDSTKLYPIYANYGFNSRHSPEIPRNTDVPWADEFTQNFAELKKIL